MADSADAKIPIPFSVADVFDYLIPGAMLLATMTLFDYRLADASLLREQAAYTPLRDLFSTVSTPILAHKDAVLSLFFVSALAVTSYVAGHITSSFSSLFIDRVLIYKGHGYPYRQLLRFPISSRRPPKSFKSAYYRGIFFWANLTFITLLAWILMAGMMLLVLAVSFALASLAFTVVKIYISNNPWRNRAGWPEERERLKGFFVGFARLYDGLAQLYTSYTGSRDSLERPIRVAYAKYFLKHFGCKPTMMSSSNYWLTSCYVIEHSPEFAKLMMNWLRLYEFARNLSTAAYLAFMYVLVSLFMHRDVVRDTPDVGLIVAPLALFTIAFMMLGRYYYLYVCYFSKFIFRSFVYLNDLKEPHWLQQRQRRIRSRTAR